MTTLNQQPERRIFGIAALLITTGVIWFLADINLISSAGVNIALSLWPVILVAVGAELLLRQHYPRTSTFVIVFIAVLVVITALLAPRLGIGVLATTTDTYAEALDDAQSATITLNPSVGQVDIHSLIHANTLFSATTTHVGNLHYEVRGTRQRTINFGQNEVSTTSRFGTDEDLSWDIALTPSIPLNINVNTGVGDANLDFSQLNLNSLFLSAGVGNVDVSLPSQETSYEVSISGGVGNLNIQIVENADIDLTVSSGLGNVEIDVPDDAAVRVNIESGIGGLNLPSWLNRLNEATDNQIWQSENFEDAVQQITIDIHSGLGGLAIK